MAGYFIVAWLLGFLLHEPEDRKFYLTTIFDAATFAGSVMLLWGIMDSDVLRLIGNTKPFLVIAGLAGVAYSLGAPFRPTSARRRNGIRNIWG
jgi:Na+-driven multidrug efflux pump